MNDIIITCYKCKKEIDSTPAWVSEKNPDSGLCAACDLKDRIWTDLRREREHPGEPFYVGSMTMHTDVGVNLVCPYCDQVYSHEDFWEDRTLYENSDGWNVFMCENENCEKDFEFNVSIVYKRLSRRIITEEDVQAEYKLRTKAK